MSYQETLEATRAKLAEHPAVYADFRLLGRPIDNEYTIKYAREEHRMPGGLVDFYAECDGLQVFWSFVGQDGTDGPEDGVLGGHVILRKLDDLRWHKLGDHGVMRLSSKWSNDGLMLLRPPGQPARLVYGADVRREEELASVKELGDPAAFFQRWLEAGMPHASIWDTPALQKQTALLTAAPAERKVTVGARVWPKASSWHYDSGTMRGLVLRLEQGSNGEAYAEVSWDEGTTTWLQAKLLAVLGRDRMETTCLNPAAAANLSELLVWLSSDSMDECFVTSGGQTRGYMTWRQALWLAQALVAVPLDQLIEAATAWIAARDVPTTADLQRESGAGGIEPGPYEVISEATYPYGPSESPPIHQVLLRRAARALVDAVIIRWLREGVEAPQSLVALDARVGREDVGSDLGACLRQRGPHAVAARVMSADDVTRGEALGLPGPVSFSHD